MRKKLFGEFLYQTMTLKY